MSSEAPERTWLRVPLLSIGLGLLAGGLEGLAVASTLRLQLSWGETFLLMLCTLLAGALVALVAAIPAGLVAQRVWRARTPSHRQALGLGLVGFVLAAWFFWPMGWGLLQQGRVAGGVAGLVVPVGFFGTVLFNARHWLRKVEIGWEPRLGWLPLCLIASLLLAVVDSGWAMRATGRAEGMALEGDKNVLIVTIDTLRRDAVSAYGEPTAVPTPRFDALAAEGVLYTDAVTPLPETGPSHASLFTALHPANHGVISNGHTLNRAFTTLAERLAAEGYATGAFVSSFAVDSRTGLDQGFGIYDDDFLPTVHGLSEIRLVGLLQRVLMRFADPLKFPSLLERGADATNARAIPWLAQRGERPFFCWVHYFEPHAPYEAHPGFTVAGEPPPEVDHRWILAHEQGFEYTPEVVADLRALYGHEVSWVDGRLGDLLDALEELGHAEDTLIIVTADHGEMLGEHDYFFNHHSIFDPAVRVPLAIRAPGLRAGTQVVDAQVRLMDVPATVMDYLRLDPMEPSEGVELLGYAEKVRHASLITTLFGRKTGALDSGTLLGLRTGRPHEEEGRPFKYIWDVDTQREQLFDLVGDPGETTDIAAEQPALMERSRRIVAQDAKHVQGESEELDRATRRALEALGYMDP
jgi:arylsulfatase A-like enzyme